MQSKYNVNKKPLVIGEFSNKMTHHKSELLVKLVLSNHLLGYSIWLEYQIELHWSKYVSYKLSLSFPCNSFLLVLVHIHHVGNRDHTDSCPKDSRRVNLPFFFFFGILKDRPFKHADHRWTATTTAAAATTSNEPSSENQKSSLCLIPSILVSARTRHRHWVGMGIPSGGQSQRRHPGSIHGKVGSSYRHLLTVRSRSRSEHHAEDNSAVATPPDSADHQLHFAAVCHVRHCALLYIRACWSGHDRVQGLDDCTVNKHHCLVECHHDSKRKRKWRCRYASLDLFL